MAKSDTSESKEALLTMLGGIAALPQVLELVQALQREIAYLRAEARAACSGAGRENGDGWIDAKGAAGYMGVCASTFDKYRYETTPRITGSAIDGKILYKKSDLDLFIRTYDAKSRRPL